MRKKTKVDEAISINKEERNYDRSKQMPTTSPNPEEQIIKDQKID